MLQFFIMQADEILQNVTGLKKHRRVAGRE
jgi:hypothetical protein